MSNYYGVCNNRVAADTSHVDWKLHNLYPQSHPIFAARRNILDICDPDQMRETEVRDRDIFGAGNTS
jgi:hypothetical protein